VRSGEAVVPTTPLASEVMPLYDDVPASPSWKTWFAGPSQKNSSSLVVSSDEKGTSSLSGLTIGYEVLYRKLMKAEDIARDKNRGIWIDNDLDKKWLFVRLYRRFRKNVKQ